MRTRGDSGISGNFKYELHKIHELVLNVKKKANIFLLALIGAVAAMAAPTEISVDLKLDNIDYISNERVRGVITVKNISPDTISVGHANSRDSLFVEVFRSADMTQLEQVGRKNFTARFSLKPNEGQKLEVMLADHYGLTQPRRYLARPVLVHGGIRYEGQYRAFDIVPGMEVASYLQTFANRPGLSRVFDLVHWSRKGHEHLFLRSHNEGGDGRTFETRDLGVMMKITKPVVSIMPSGKVLVLHRYGPDDFIRTEFWSMGDTLEFISRELVRDPETAGQAKVQELYEQSGGIKPVERPWWKFW